MFSKLFIVLTQASSLSFLCSQEKTCLNKSVLLLKNHRLMCVIKVLNAPIRYSIDKYLHCYLKNIQYVFIFCILFLGLPDKDSMSSSALCQVSKNCNKVNPT